MPYNIFEKDGQLNDPIRENKQYALSVSGSYDNKIVQPVLEQPAALTTNFIEQIEPLSA